MMFLTRDEIAELTERKTKSAQIAWLKVNGFHFVIGANGHPRVLREYVASRMGGHRPQNTKASLEPNWSAL